MDTNPFNAAFTGDGVTLRQLLKEDPLILFKATMNCEDKNPLHIAAMLGNVDFFSAIIETNPSSCYHMCLARDRDGRNALHLAAVYGNWPVLELLIDSEFRDAALEKADGGGTILHLCVKYNQLDVLKELVKKFPSPEFVNAKNEDGMTILHLAIYYNRAFEDYISYLIDVTKPGLTDITDANGNTAVDLLVSGGYTEDRKILKCLKEVGAAHGLIRERRPERRQWLEKSKDGLMVVASLIATMAFQVVVSPPGGVWQDELLEGPNPHRIGQAVMAQSHPKYYRLLNTANALAFTSSLTTIILLMGKPGRLNKFLMPTLVLVMRVAVAAIATSYALSIVMVVPKDARSAEISDVAEILVIVLSVWGGWMYIKICETVFGRFLSKIFEGLYQVRRKMLKLLFSSGHRCACCVQIFYNCLDKILPPEKRSGSCFGEEDDSV